MITLTTYLISIIALFIVGFLGGRFLFQRNFQKKILDSELKAKKIIHTAEVEAEKIKKEKFLESKEKQLQLKAEHEQIIFEKNKKIAESENRARQKESQLSQKEGFLEKKNKELESIRENLTRQTEIVQQKQQLLEKDLELQTKQLEKISGVSAQEAKDQLLEALKAEVQTKAIGIQQQIIDEAKQNANKEARKIIIQSIQRLSAEQSIENSVTVFHIDSDELKGQIIGREGRNIRALEAATGVDLIIDDTPEAIVLSCFDPLRREIAKLSLQQLVTDGRIHPARIEEVVEKTKKQIEEQVIEIGERTVTDLGIHGIHKDMIRLIGKMRFRSSYGQNLLMHSREVANLCAIMASELGIPPKLAKRAGLLHDIGKVPDEQSEISHALLGMKWAQKYGEHPSVCNAIGAHHDEVGMEYVISPIIQACDSISGARPGARREVMQQYIQRIKDLENLALGYNGVEKAYAIQAGRELRVIVESEKITDEQSSTLSFDIATKIQNEMTYPGQVKVTVIREKRTISVAK